MAQKRTLHWVCIILTLTVVCFCLLATLVAVIVLHVHADCIEGDRIIDVSEPSTPGVFHDLTQKELKSITEFMYSLTERFTLLKPPSYAVNASHIYGVHLYLPPKAEVLQHLDNGRPQPARQAKVVLFRGDLTPPVVQEYIVGPLPDPTYCDILILASRKTTIPFEDRPFNYPEIEAMLFVLLSQIEEKIGFILLESYDAKFTDCGTKCITFYPSSIIPGSGRKVWFRAMASVEGYAIHPLGIDFLFDLGSINPADYKVDMVYYAGRSYNSLDRLALLYNTSNIPKIKIPFPEVNKDLFSTMNLRGDPVPSTPQARPRLYEPNGRRFSIKHGEVSYMQWRFQVGMHLFFGPRVYDVRFNGERIAYEVALQEIAVVYSGHSPGVRSSSFLDSVSNMGGNSKDLKRGADCPETAVFMDTFKLNEGSADPVRVKNAFCVFELNMGIPMKRHLAHQSYTFQFYSGTENSALVVRSIHAIDNYDYIVDFIFHQTGALETRVASTGYISGAFNNPGEDQYGYQLHENLVGNIHQHLFHFKVDLDILGTSNRYETKDIYSERVGDNSAGPQTENLWLVKHKSTLHKSESDAVYKLNFETPKYHLIYNEDKKTKYGKPRAYRIHSTGVHKQLLPEGTGTEESFSWARNQMTLTKMKDEERESSSIYGVSDLPDPVVNFTNFYKDNDSLVDEDIVAWLTLGLYHIPHTEDLPVTPTVGGHLGFFLLPYNYFDECPSVQSRDAIRVDLIDQTDQSKGSITKTYGKDRTETCIP